MTPVDGIYDFAYRGQLAEQALDREGRPHPKLGLLDEDIAERVSLHQLDDVFVEQARRMATVYTAIAAFENTVRDLVRRVLLEEGGADWWEKKVSAAVQKRAAGRQEEEAKHRFHTQRGDDPISFIDFGDLLNVIARQRGRVRPVLAVAGVGAGHLRRGRAFSQRHHAQRRPRPRGHRARRHEHPRLGPPGRRLTHEGRARVGCQIHR